MVVSVLGRSLKDCNRERFVDEPPCGQFRIPDVCDQTVLSLAEEMNKVGFAVLPNYISPEDISELRALVESAVEKAGGEYVLFKGRDEVAGTLLSALPESPRFRSLLHRLYAIGAGKRPPAQSIYQVLRCLAGRSGLRESFIFHFDSYLVTALVPIIIPPDDLAGHLIMTPNLRKPRRFYVLNLIDKLVLDNAVTQFALKQLIKIGWVAPLRVDMAPGNLYLFWGYRSLHANEPCDTQKIRATALFHFGDPHAESPLRRRMGRVKV